MKTPAELHPYFQYVVDEHERECQENVDRNFNYALGAFTGKAHARHDDPVRVVSSMQGIALLFLVA